MGYSLPSSVLVQSIQVQGNGVSSWISKLVIKYRLLGNTSEFQCVNNCTAVDGARGVSDVATISFPSPVQAM